MDALRQPFHTFSEEDVFSLGHLSAVAFEPLLRPFRELRIEQKFSFRETLKTGFKRGYLLPAYERVKIPTRASNLVIALSLNGIDRCSGVALIPLLLKLREVLEFKIFIYTTDLIEAEVRDNHFANDHQLDWNHVYAPRVFRKLAAEMQKWKGGSKPELLIIDSCGGQGSDWYTSEWTSAHQDASRSEYNALVREWAELRKQANGDYTTLRNLADTAQRRKLTNLVKKNSTRFVDAPGLGYFLQRWLFNPEMRARDWSDPPIENSAGLITALDSLRRSCGNIHWMAPAEPGGRLQDLINWGRIDYVHRTDSIFGFGEVLGNICHGRCTNRLTRDTVTYGLWHAKTNTGDDDREIPLVWDGAEGDTDVDELTEPEAGVEPGDDDDDRGSQPGDEAEGDEDPAKLLLVKNSKTGIQLARPPYPTLPCTTHTFKARSKEWGDVKDNIVAFRSITPSINDDHTLTEDVCRVMNALFYGVEFDDVANTNLSALSKQRVVDEVLLRMRTKQLLIQCNSRGQLAVDFHALDEWTTGASQLCPTAALRLLPNSEVGKTRHLFASTRSHFNDCLRMFDGAYGEYCHAIPLYQLAYEERAEFSPAHLAITFRPDGDYRRSIWHECGHYFEDICPPLSICCHQFFLDRIEPTDFAHIATVGLGEKAYINPRHPWIDPYVGKHYPPLHRQLPAQTEIMSMHLESFASYGGLYKLISLDREAFFFTCFVLMGGPVKLLQAMTAYKEAKAFKRLENKSHSYSGYRYRRRRGGGRSSGGVSKKTYGFGL